MKITDRDLEQLAEAWSRTLTPLSVALESMTDALIRVAGGVTDEMPD